MSLPLKIKIQKTNQTKVVKFAPNMSVAECIRSIQEKGIEGGVDHGLFQPLGPKNPARWLRNDRTLQYYDLQPNDELEYKKRHRPLKIKLMDDTIKTILVDDTLSVGEIVDVIGQKMSISNAEEFSLKVESKGDWLNHTQSLHEQGVGEDAMLLFQKKFYVSDQLVSAEDPVALHLVYIQSRDAILAGDHPCTQDEAIAFGALQCHIVYGSYDPSKNRKLEEEKLIPLQWRKKKLDEKILREYKKFVGMTEVNAKYRFVQLCRSLKTYGITFFLCKQKIKGQKKPKSIKLGVTRDSVLFMDEETKEISQENPITHLRRWAAAPTTFTLDFGDHLGDYIVLETKEGDAISSLLAGYIDILLRKQKASSVIVKDDSDVIAVEEPIAPITSSVLTSVTMSTMRSFAPGMMSTQGYGGGMNTMRMNQSSAMQPTNLASAQGYVASLVNDWKNTGNTFSRNMNMSVQQWRSQLVSNTNAVMSSVGKLSAVLPPNSLDKGQLDGKAAEIAANLAQLISAARNAAFKNNGEDDPNLLAGAKMVADAIKDLLAASKDLSDKPNDPKAIERYAQAQKSLQAAIAYLSAANKGKLSDESSMALMNQSAKSVFSAVDELLSSTRGKNANNQQVSSAADNTKFSSDQLQTAVASLAPAIMDPSCRSQLSQVCNALETSVANLLQTAKLSGDSSGLGIYAKDVSDALAQLLSSANIAESPSVLPDFTREAKEMFEQLSRLMGAQGNAGQIIQSSKAITSLSSKIATACREAASMLDDETKDRMMTAVKSVATSTHGLVQSAQGAAANPESVDAHKALQDACQRLAEAVRNLVGDAVEKAAMKNLRSAAKVAAGATTGLISYSRVAANTCSDPAAVESLRTTSKQASEAVVNLVKALEAAWKDPDDQVAQEALLKEVNIVCPQAYKLVAASQSAVRSVTDNNNKNFLKSSAAEAADSLQKLVEASKALVVSSGQALIDQAIERFAAEESHLVSALMDVDSGTLELDPNQTPDGAAQLLNIATRQVAGSIKTLATTAKTNSDELGNASMVVAESITQSNTAAKALAATIPEKSVQRSILNAAKDLTVQARNALTSARSVAANPTDPALNSLLANSARGLAEALAGLLAAAKGISTVGKECDDAVGSITNTMKALNANLKQGNPRDFAAFAEDLENNVKAVQASCQLLYSAAKNNPKGVGSAAKSTALTMPPFISSATLTAGACSVQDTQNAIIASTFEASQAVTELIGSAKQAINRANDSGLIENLAAASSNVNTSLDRLLNALSSATPAQKQFADAVDETLRAAERLAQGPGELQEEDVGTSIDQIKNSTTKLGEATKGIISSSRTNPDQMAGFAKHAASAISTIVDASLMLASGQKISVYVEEAVKVKEAAEELVHACIISDPTQMKQSVIKAARDITLATQSLAETVRKNAATAEDPEVQQMLNFTGQTIAAATTSLVTAAKGVVGGQPGAAQNVQSSFNTLISVLDDLLVKDPDQTLSAKAKKLLNIVRDATSSTSIMIENSKNVHKRPTDSEALAELSQSARSVGAAIRGLLDAAKAIGEIDLEEALAKISQAGSELDQALISSTVGLLENTAPPGKTTQNLEESLVEAARNLAGAIRSLVQEKENPVALAKAARSTAEFIPEIAKIATQIAGITSDLDKQQETLGVAKNIADSTLALINACKQNDVKEIVGQAKDSSQAIAKMLASLKGGVIALRDCDEAAKAIAESMIPLSKFNLNNVDQAGNYVESQRQLTALAKELAAAIGGTANIAKTRPTEVGEGAKRIAAAVQKFSAATIEALSTIDSVESRSDLLNSAQSMLQASDRFVKCVKLVAQDPKNAKTQQALSATNKDVTESISRLIGSIKQAATGEVKCEEAIDSINRRIADLDSAALYAATGELKPESEDVDVDQSQNDMAESCNRIQDALRRLTAAASKNQAELGNAATDSMESYEKLTRESKNIASQIPNLLAQQEILTGTKAVGITVQLAVTSGLNVHKQPNDRALRDMLQEASLRVGETIKDLLAATANAAATSGIKDIESARKSVVQAIGQFAETTPNQRAGAADVLKAAKNITDSVATVYTATSAADDAPKIAAACVELKSATTSIVQDSKGAIRLTNAENGRKLTEACKAVLQSTAGFLEAAKAQKKAPTPDAQRAVSEANDDLVKMIGDLVEAARPLPGSDEALKLFQETDELENLAEQELMQCASAIEDAAKTLLAAKQRQLEMRKNKDTPMPEEEIQEAIIDAAKAITGATATLVAAATVAQKELVTRGKAEKSQNQYRRDPAWSKGLISAAQAVAGSVKGLVMSANSTVAGKTAEESLIASAKDVAAATARLVFASRAKADPFSPTQKKLSAAAKAVAEATKQLIEAAKSAQVQTQENDSKPDWSALTETDQKKAQLLAQANIIKIQSDLEKATRALGDLRKKEYAEANKSAAEKSAPQPQHTPVQRTSSGSIPPPVKAVPSPVKKTSGAARVLPGEKFFTLEQLAAKPPPPECDPARLELYLTDEEFVAVFGIDKALFAKQPIFKQTNAKKALGIF